MEDLLANFDGIGSFLMSALVSVGMAIVVIIVILMFLKRMRFNKSIEENQNMIFLHVRLPLTNQNKENAMEEFLKSIHHILPQSTTISLEMFSKDQFINFYIVIPQEFTNAIQSQLYSQFPEAEIEEKTDYLDNTENVVFVDMKFKHGSSYPLNTYKNTEDNFLKNLSALLSKTEAGDQVYFQLALKKVGSKFYERGMKGVKHHFFGAKYSGENATPQQTKLSQDLYMGKLRLGYKAADRGSAQKKLHGIIGLLRSVKNDGNELKRKGFSFGGNLARAYMARAFEDGDFWTPAELATLYHFPYSGMVASNIVHTTSKRAPAPDILPVYGVVDPSEACFFGETNYRNERKMFGIKRFDRRRHMYVIGKTGSGKSRLLELLLLSDIMNGHGCCLIDPHGDLATELLRYIPQDRIQDVVWVDPANSDFPIGFNPLEPVADYQVRQHLASFFIAIFKKLFASSWNQRMEHLLRYITLALLETKDSNILGIPRILSDTTFRQNVIMQIQDPVVKSFWINEFSSWNEQYANDAIVPIINKVGQFVANPTIRNMVGQKDNVLNFEKFMNEGKIVLVNLSKGKLGDDNAALLGAMFITKIQQAALARADIPEEQRRDFYLYVDEFQNFATEAFSTILSEARKYRLNLTIAHQYVAQLPDEVKATALGNVGTIISFAIGGDDAAYLAKEFSPTFTPDDMMNLSMREMYVKMSIDGKLVPPFSAQTITVPESNYNFTQEIMEFSRMTYGRDRATVEREIFEWTQAGNDMIKQAGPPKEEDFPEPII